MKDKKCDCEKYREYFVILVGVALIADVVYKWFNAA